MESLSALGRLRRTNCVVENCVVGLWEFELAQEGRAVSAPASTVIDAADSARRWRMVGALSLQGQS